MIAKHARLSKRLSLLEDKPHHENARIWFRKGQYAYLHVSLHEGRRSRTYIGKNTERIAAIEEAIACGARVSQLKASIRIIEEQARYHARRIGFRVGKFMDDVATTVGEVKISRKEFDVIDRLV